VRWLRQLHFPRIELAVIMLVEAPDRRRCLLARRRRGESYLVETWLSEME
jgi:NADH pyrophosphatase NudC (nudix superfamily)